MNRQLIGFISLFLLLLLVSCGDDNRFFEQNTDFKEATWHRDTVPQFSFEITDTSQRYHLVYAVRNSVNYPYYNLYLESQMVDSTGLVVSTFENELYLFDPSSGKPFGSGNYVVSSSLGDVFDGRYLCQSYYKFPRPGKYIFTVEQAMRGDAALEEILAIGLRIEQVKQSDAGK